MTITEGTTRELNPLHNLFHEKIPSEHRAYSGNVRLLNQGFELGTPICMGFMTVRKMLAVEKARGTGSDCLQ